MPPKLTKPLSEQISWNFTVTHQRHTTRYGTLGTEFYRQFLPAGIPIDARHPPKRSSVRLYRRAEREHNAMSQEPPGSGRQ